MNRCAGCSAENPAGAHFCMGCGAPLQRRCATCGAAVPEQARFCMTCGAQLQDTEHRAGTDREEQAPSAIAAPGAQEPDERRTATVLFADLSGYTAIAENLDPESVKRLLERILARLGKEVGEYGGYVDKFIGDNVMAIFGAPVAHGDDAERAVRAGLAMQAAMDEINEPLTQQHGVRFALCVGINTGEVLAGRVGDSYTVIGDSVNVAARLQAAARPGTVTVGERTYSATRDAIDYRGARAAAGAEGQGASRCTRGRRSHRRLRRRRPSRSLSPPARRWSAARPSWPSFTGSSSGSSRGAARTWRRSSAKRASASRGCWRSSSGSLGLRRWRR